MRLFLMFGLCFLGLGFGSTELFAEKPLFMINEDCGRYFKKNPQEKMNIEDLQAFVDQFENTKVTHLIFNPNAQRTAYRSLVYEAAWDIPNIDSYRKGTGIRNLKYLDEQGIDPFLVWTKRCREKGLSPWISIRMNDIHDILDRNNVSHSTFWREHPQYWRVPHSKGKRMGDYALDYAHSEVRERQLALVHEVLDRYDIDGIEIDWMRFGKNLAPARAKEDAHFLTDFIRLVRAEANQSANQRGHRIQVAVRIPATPQISEEFGLNGIQWAKKGLVDYLIVTPMFSTDFEIPLNEWRKLLGDAATHVTVVPSVDHLTVPGPAMSGTDNDLAVFCAWAMVMLYQANESFYFFNWMYYRISSEDFRFLLENGINEEALRNMPRRHLVSFHDHTENAAFRDNQIPCRTNKDLLFRVQVGKKPDKGTVRLVLGLSDRKGVEQAQFNVQLNGNKATTTQQEIANPKKYHRLAQRALLFEFPLHALKDGENEVFLSKSPTSIGQEIIWVELELR